MGVVAPPPKQNLKCVPAPHNDVPVVWYSRSGVEPAQDSLTHSPQLYQLSYDLSQHIFYPRYPYQNYTLCENIGKAIRFNEGVGVILSCCEKFICSPIVMKTGIKLAAGILHLKKSTPKKIYWNKSYKAIKLCAKIVNLPIIFKS